MDRRFARQQQRDGPHSEPQPWGRQPPRPPQASAPMSRARSERRAPHSVMNPVWFSSGCATLASPKSQTFRSQLPLSSRFDGLRSR